LCVRRILYLQAPSSGKLRGNFNDKAITAYINAYAFVLEWLRDKFADKFIDSGRGEFVKIAVTFTSLLINVNRLRNVVISICISYTSVRLATCRLFD